MRNSDVKADILVVDDQELIVKSLVLILGGCGYSVSGVTSGRAAIQYVRDRSPRLALVDLHLPDANGVELAGRLARIVPGIKLLIATGDPEAALDMQPEVLAGTFEIVSKPMPPAELLAKIEEVLTGKDAQKAA